MNLADNLGFTALHYSAMFDCGDSVTLLLGAAADPSRCCGKKEWTALSIAESRRSEAALRALERLYAWSDVTLSRNLHSYFPHLHGGNPTLRTAEDRGTRGSQDAAGELSGASAYITTTTIMP